MPKLQSNASIRIFYIGVTLAILIVAITASLAIRLFRQEADARIATTTQNMVLSLDQTLESILDSVDVALLASADEINRQLTAGQLAPKSVTQFLITQQKRLTHVSFIRATNEVGDVIYGPGVLTPPTSSSDRDHFMSLKSEPQTSPFVGAARVGRIDNQWHWVVARPIHKPDGSFGGVVFAGILVSEIDNMLAKLAMDRGGVATIRNADLGVITRYTFGSTNPIPYGDKRISKPFEDALKQNPNEGTYVSGGTSIDGIARTQSYRANSKYGVLVNVGIAGETVLAEWRKQAGIVILLALAFTVAALAFTWMILRAWHRTEQDFKAIREAEEKSRAIIEASPVPIAINDELGNIIFLNKAFIQRLGYTRDDIPTLADWWPRAYPDVTYRNWVLQSWQQSLDQAIRNKAPFEPLEVRVQCKDGGHRIMLVGAERMGASLVDTHLVTLYDITERHEVEVALRESQRELLEVQKLSHIGTWRWDIASDVHEWSAEVYAIFGRNPGSGRAVAPMIQQYYSAEGGESVRLAASTCAQDGTPFQCDAEIVRPDGTNHWILIFGEALRDGDGNIISLRGSIQDITERKRAEKILQASLKEKVALLNEVHHRVKNNLQVIASLLRLEAGRSGQPETKAVLGDMQGRIRSMALLHESLYRSGIFAQVDLAYYLNQLATQAFRSQINHGTQVRLQLDMTSIQISMDQATPCGLLVNELISNCFKHGFPEGSQGEIRVLLEPLLGSDQIRLCVSDTGVGLPSDFEARRAQSLGLQLVSDLTRQIGGTLTIGPGASFCVTFSAETLKN